MSRRSLVRSLVLLPLLTVILTACGTESTGPTSAADDTASDPAPTESSESSSTGASSETILDFSADTVDGDRFEGASLAGRPAVLWFWAPWCPTCRGQIEGVSALADEYGDDVSFVGVGSLDEAAAIEDFADDVPADLPHLLDPDGDVWRHFGIVEQSTYVVLDDKSEVVSQGYLDDDELADLVSGLAG